MSMNWDTGSRRESRIPKVPVGASGDAKPLAERQNTMDRKRRGAPLESVPESKRPLRKTSPAASAAATPAADKPAEETFEDIQERTGMTVQDILNRKLQFKKGTLPAKKLEEMGPVIKDLKAVGWHLLAAQERTELDAKQWKQHSEELEASSKQKEQELQAARAQLEQQLEGLKAELAAAAEQRAELESSNEAGQQQVVDLQAQLAALQQQLEALTKEGEALKGQVAERDAKVSEMEGVVRQSQCYSATLQSYNTSLQSDVQAEKAKREEVVREREELQSRLAELGGMTKSLERLLQLEQEQCEKLRQEREQAGRDVAVLRTDLDCTRGDKERLAQELKDVKDQLDKYMDAGGRSAQTLEAMENNKATLEAQLTTQRSLLDNMRGELAAARETAALADSLANSRGTQLQEAKAQITTLQASLADAERRVYESELIRRKLHNTIQELKGNIRVFARVRPPANHELTDGGASGIATDFPNSGELLGRGIDITLAPGQKYSFAFDKVFAPAADQAAVFEEISELVQSALDGHKVCIFAYGQTGSGKTYTMLGNPENKGIIPRAIQQVFDSSRALAAQGWSFTMQASMLEIYNEDYRDLLAKKKLPEGKKHNVVHDAAGNTTVSELTLVDVNTPEAVATLLSRAMEKRSVGCTALNEESSRSHAVFTLRIEGVNAASQLKVSGQLNLIDLAGSERVKDSGATGQRLKEAQNINKSLSALGDVIMALANKESHIPYRNSRLTWLLQPCLGGDAKTLMFVNLSPSTEYAQESLCSLRFAAKVNACEVGVARRNVKTT